MGILATYQRTDLAVTLAVEPEKAMTIRPWSFVPRISRPWRFLQGAVVLALCSLAACDFGGGVGGRSTPAPTIGKIAQCEAYTGPALAELRHFEGMTHEHSAYSDGHPNYVPADYFRIGQENGYDFTAGAEHSDSLDAGNFATLHAYCDPTNDQFDINSVEYCFLNPTADKLQKWLAYGEQATTATTENYLAIRGFEWTSDVFGHINVYFSKNFTNAKTDGGYALTMETFWDWFTRDPETPGLTGSPSSPVPLGGGADGLAHFNHPHDKCFTEDDPTGLTAGWCDWNAYELVPEAEPRMFGMELYNDSNRNDRYLPYYADALDKGWHLSPLGSEDEHFAQYAVEERPKTVTLATQLSEAGFKEAWKARRTYALSPGQHLRAELSVGPGAPMGSRLNCTAGSVPLTVSVTQRDGTAIRGSFNLFTNGGELLAVQEGERAEFALPVELGKERWFFIRVDDREGQSLAYLAPVWIQGQE